MGPPGVGKGTQSQRLAREFKVPIIATGDMLRRIRAQDSCMGAEVRDYMDRGEYVPDGLTIEMALARLAEADARGGFILDGFPRTVRQAEALDAAFSENGRRIDHVVLLKAPPEVVLDRLAGRWICSGCGQVYNERSNPPRFPGSCDVCGGELFQRTDETAEVQRHRLEVYEHQTRPVLAYYKASKRLEVLDATKPVDRVTEELRHLLGKGAPAR